MTGATKRWISSTSPARSACAASTGPSIVTSPAAHCTRVRTASASKLLSSRVRRVGTLVRVEEKTTLSALCHSCANRAETGESAATAGSVSHTCISWYMRRP